MTLQSPAQPSGWTFRRVVGDTLILVLVALSIWLLYRFYRVIFIFLISILLGTVMRPAVAWIQKRGISLKWGTILVYFLLLVLLVSFMLVFVPIILEQGTLIIASLPSYYQDFHAWIGLVTNIFVQSLVEFLPTALPSLKHVQQSNQQNLASAGLVLGYAGSVVEVIFTISVILVIAIRWTLEGTRIIQTLLSLIPMDKRENIAELISAMETKVGFYIIGQGILCLIIGILAFITYLFIGLPNPLLLALIAGVLEAIPMIGPLLGALPAAAVALSIAPSKLVWVVAATLVMQQVENSVLVPRIMRKAVGVNPFVSLIAIFAFSSLFGISGALMAIPLAAIIQLLLNRFVFEPTEMESEVTTGRDHASRLRYEAQYLAKDLRKQARIKKWGSDKQIKQIDRVMDEIEEISTDLDTLLAGAHPLDIPK